MSYSCDTPPELLTAAQVREADRLAEAAGVPVAVLMENAGRAVADAICRRYGKRETRVLVGGGNNGGDGFATARILKERGWPVSVLRAAASCEWKAAAAAAQDAWQAAGGETQAAAAARLDASMLLVDALLGTGFNRAPEGEYAAAIQAVNECGAPVVAVDIPSGIAADSGVAPGVAVRAALTVTFFRAKPGLFLLPGKQHAGEVQVADIGIPDGVLAEIRPRLFLNTPAVWRGTLPVADAAQHKYQRGHALVAGGPLASMGASKLAAVAALRARAGLVSVACQAEALGAYAASLTSAMTKLAPTPRDYAALAADRRITALLVGPGNGVTEDTRLRLAAALGTRKRCVLDADAITLLAEHRRSLLSQLHETCVLTPHEGEFARLFETGGDRLSRALRAACEAGCVMVLKGNDTVIATPDGQAVINTGAPAALATAGTGDVLAGIVTGLLAQGMDPLPAACMGVWLHSEAARLTGAGLIAEDLAAQLPRVWRRLTG